MIKIENLTIKYKEKQTYNEVVSNINFEIEDGKIIALLGESGCGKTTILKAILGILPKNAIVSGTIQYNKKSVNFNDIKKELAFESAFYIPQQIYTSLSPVHKIGTMFLDFAKINNEKINKRELNNDFIDVLNSLGLKNDILKKYPFQLSGGMLQRAVVAMAVALRNKMIILDEPTSALDKTNQKKIIKALKRINKDYGVTIIVVSHEEDLVLKMATHVLILREEGGYEFYENR